MRSRAGVSSGLLLLALLVVAANQRGPIAAVGPVMDRITAELALSPAAVGMLTGLPLLCFALAAPIASGAIARFGVGACISGALSLLIAGTALRSVAGFETALLGTLLVGIAITVGNLAIPVVTRRDFPLLIAGVTGASTAAMNLGAMTTTALTAPLAELHGWRWATAAWGLGAVAALSLWLVAERVRRSREAGALAGAGSTTSNPAPGPREDGVAASAVPEARTALEPRPVLRRPFVWALALVFAVQSFGYYGMTAWLPQILGDTLGLGPTGAGGAAAPFQAAAVVSALLVPVALARGASARAVFLSLVGMWLTLPLGLLLAPGGWPLWVSLAGMAQGGLYTVVISVILHRAASVPDARRSSAAVQTIGYLLAATGPSILGQLFASSGGWAAPMVLLMGLFALAACLGAFAMRPVRG